MAEVILFDAIHYTILLNIQYGLNGSQLQYVLRAVWQCFKTQWRKRDHLLWNKFKTTERYWSVLEKPKKWPFK